jgi:hypothetical protein
MRAYGVSLMWLEAPANPLTKILVILQVLVGLLVIASS